MRKVRELLTSPATILRLGAGICFVGHGVLALGAKAGFVTLLGTFGLGQENAVLALKFIGLLDILVGLLIVFRPSKPVLIWAMAWAALTVVAWGIHGDSLMDLFRRVPYIATPMALLFLLHKRESSMEKNLPTEEVEPQLVNTIEETTAPLRLITEAQEEAINNLDLSMICMKLMDRNDGEGWSNRQCAEVSVEYRRYLTLKLLYPNESVVPNLAIDTMWHYHILDTAAYQRDCTAIFGEMLHHYPYFGMKGKEDERQFVSAFDKTKMLYEQTFGTSMDDPDYLPSLQVSRSA